MIDERIELETYKFFLYLCFFPWVVSWRDFHWGCRGCQESRPHASPEFVPGYTDLLSAAPAYNNPHPHRQSALQAPKGVPAVPGGLGSCAAVLSWPQGRGLSPAESPDGVSKGACCCCGAVSHQLLPFLSPSHTESSQSSRRAPRHWRKQRQRSQRVHGRLSPGKMQQGRVKRKSEGDERKEKKQAVRWDSQLFKMRSVLFRSGPIRGADTTEYFTTVGTSTKSSLRNGLIQDLLSSTSPPTVVETHEDLTVAFQAQTGKTRQLLKQSDLSTSYIRLIYWIFFVNTCRLHAASKLFMGFVGKKRDSNHEKQTLKRRIYVFTSKNFREKV